MLTHCITSMIKCDEILTMKHADWSKKGCSSRRLCLDYSSPKDYEAENLKLNDVDIRALWGSGHMKARARALETGLVKSIDSLVLLGYTLRKPFGKMIGVTEVEVDVSMDENVNSNVPDVTEEEESVLLTDMIQNEKCTTIEVDGKNIYKATVVNQLFSRNKLSKDRLRRVQGLSAGAPGESTQKIDDNNLIFIGDPLVVYSEERSVIANIQKILGNQNKKYINIDDLESKNYFTRYSHLT